MRLDRLTRLLIVGTALALPAMSASAGDAEHGRKLAYTCMGCHGIDSYKNAYPKYSVPSSAARTHPTSWPRSRNTRRAIAGTRR